MINQRRVQLTNRLQKTLRQKTNRKRFVRYWLIAANVLILGAVVGFVATSSHRDRLAARGTITDSADVTNPVDGQTSYDIAANIAHLASLPESNAIDNQAQSAHAAVAVSTSDVSIVAKPQLVATAIKTRADIQSYVVQAGDTVASIAQKLGVTSDSIKWSNNLTTDKVTVGVKLTVPPAGVNGLVYTVKAGDTVQTLADKYKTDADKITNFNDAEKSGLAVGEQILIPGGQVLAPVSLYSSLRSGSFVAQYGSNGYDYGYCTYYAAYRSGAPSNWGNANTWAYYAALSGWTVSGTPRVGAIAQTSGGYLGHVAIVEAVSDDGTQIKYSDMNGVSGWGRVGYSDWVPISRFQHYIYR
jgi:surface antigen/uncharacterized protein YpmS